MVSRTEPRPPGSVAHFSRGLCLSCHRASLKDDTIEDYPRIKRRREDVIQDFREILARTRTHPLTRAEIARMMGMSFSALDQALCRARRDGIDV